MPAEEWNPYATPESAFATTPQAVSDRLDPIFAGAQWPLRFQFKLLTFSPKINVFDATDRCLVHAKQKLFRFREHVELFTDPSRTHKLGEIRANKVIDWSARYNFTDEAGDAVGSVGRKGWRSIWRAHYEAFNPGDESPDFQIREENPMAKVADSLVGSIPVIGLLTTVLFHPKYLATRIATNTPTFRLTKKPAFWEGKFEFENLAPATSRETLNIILSFMMLALLERRRG